jgi:hypothetical protein
MWHNDLNIIKQRVTELVEQLEPDTRKKVEIEIRDGQWTGVSRTFQDYDDLRDLTPQQLTKIINQTEHDARQLQYYLTNLYRARTISIRHTDDMLGIKQEYQLK